MAIEAEGTIGTRGRFWAVYKVMDSSPPQWEWSVSGPKGSRSGTEASEEQARVQALEAYAEIE